MENERDNQGAELLLDADRFRVEQIRLRDATGEVVRQVIRHPGAVVIVPLVDEENVCLIKNYRIAVEQTLIELPAGTLEENEPPIETAQRELIEETGYTAAVLEPQQAFFLSPGILDERMHLFVARELTAGDPEREAGEQIENFIVGWQEALAMIYDGQIQDAKTIIGLLLADRLRKS